MKRPLQGTGAFKKEGNTERKSLKQGEEVQRSSFPHSVLGQPWFWGFCLSSALPWCLGGVVYREKVASCLICM